MTNQEQKECQNGKSKALACAAFVNPGESVTDKANGLQGPFSKYLSKFGTNSESAREWAVKQAMLASFADFVF